MKHSALYDLLMNVLVSTGLVFGAFVRNEELTWNLVEPNTFRLWLAWSAAAGLLQTALLIARCAAVHHWAAEYSPQPPERAVFLSQHVRLATLATIFTAVGVVIVYDGYWHLYAAYSRPFPDNPVFLDVLWYLGYVIGLAAAIGYGAAIVWQIRRLYRLTLWQGIFALVMGLIAEIVVYGTMGGIWIMLVIIIGSHLS